MTTSTEIAPEKKEKSLAARIVCLTLICATLFVCYFSRLGAIGFLGPDEPRYAWIARDMAETGDWVTPRLYGNPWFEKPPLYYWGAAVSFKLFGVSETAARLPSAFSALLATLALAWLAWRLYASETARWVLLLLPTTIGMIGFSHAAATDMPFSGTLTIAMVCATVILRITETKKQEAVAQHSVPPQGRGPDQQHHPATLWAALLLFGFFLGLAVLAKGPAALVLCAGVVLFWALFTKRWRDALRLLHPAAIAVFCLTALPWYILCARRNPDFLRIFIVEHNFKRYLTTEFQHIQPFWFYVPVILIAMLPWAPSLVAVFGEMKPALRSPSLRSSAIFLAAWVLFPCLFFSLSQSKLPGYILPAIPPLALFCAAATSKLVAARSRFARALFVSTSLIVVIMFAGAFQYSFALRSPYAVRELATHAPGSFVSLGLVCLLGVTAAIITVRGRPRVGALLTVAALVLFLWSANLARLDTALSAREICRGINNLKQPPAAVFLCSIPRSYTYAFNFYLRSEVPEWSSQYLDRPAILVIGSPACWSALQGARYHLKSEFNSARWPVVLIEAVSPAGAADGKAQ